MRSKILLLLGIFIILTSCSSDDSSSEIVRLRLNHHKITGFGFAPVLVLQHQQENDIGSEQWIPFYNTIEGFNYVPGNIYDLKVLREEIKNPPQDASSSKYTLLSIDSIEAVDPSEPFEIDLKFGGQNFVTVNSGYSILDQIDMDCQQLCNELDFKLLNQEMVTGTFQRISTEEIKLISIN